MDTGAGGERGAALAALLTRPGTALIADEAAQELAVTAGDVVVLRVGTRRVPLEIVGVLSARAGDNRPGLGDVLVADLATAQEVVEAVEVRSRSAGAARGERDTEGVRSRSAGAARGERDTEGVRSPSAGAARGERDTEGVRSPSADAARGERDTAGRIDRIDLIVPDGAAGDALLARIGARLPAGAEIVAAAGRSQALTQMTRAFHVNLEALALLALFVGLFLVGNAMTFSVVQRRPLLGTLAALGVTRRELVTLVLVEAAALGLVATALGVPLGVVLARGMVRLVTRTINDLYLVLVVRELAWDPVVFGKAIALGAIGPVVAALGPAFEAARATPRAAMSRATLERGTRRLAVWLALAGAGLAGLGTGVLALAGRHLALSYAGLFAAFLGAALAAPLATIAVLRVVEPPLSRLGGPVARLAARGIVASLSRTGVAVAALMIAVATTVGVSLMIASFRTTVTRWLEASLQADVYVSAPSLTGNRPGSTLPPALVARLAAVPGVAAIGTSRLVQIPSPAGRIHVVALDIPAAGRRAFRLAAGRSDDAWSAFTSGAVLVSEPFAYHRGVGPGDALRLRTDRGEGAFPVAGVVHDYGSSEGVVLMSRATYERFWDDRGVTSLGIHAAPGAEDAGLIRALRAAAGPDADVVIRSNRRLREDSLAIFDRTFAVTAVLRILVTAVAFVGVLAALMAQELERARELAVLRVHGLTPAEVWRLVLVQSGLVGLVSGLLALPAGVGLAAVLVSVINRRSFGWTIDLTVTPGALGQALAVALGAALLAALYPAARLARAWLPGALREE